MQDSGLVNCLCTWLTASVGTSHGKSGVRKIAVVHHDPSTGLCLLAWLTGRRAFERFVMVTKLVNTPLFPLSPRLYTKA